MTKALDSCYIVPMSPLLRRDIDALRGVTQRQLLELALNARLGTRARIAMEAAKLKVEATLTVVEIVLGLNRALNKAYPELMEDARGKRVVDVSFNQRQMIVVLRPAEDRVRKRLSEGESDG